MWSKFHFFLNLDVPSEGARFFLAVKSSPTIGSIIPGRLCAAMIARKRRTASKGLGLNPEGGSCFYFLRESMDQGGCGLAFFRLSL